MCRLCAVCVLGSPAPLFANPTWSHTFISPVSEGLWAPGASLGPGPDAPRPPGSAFQDTTQCHIQWLSLKTVFLLAFDSTRLMGALHKLSVPPKCCRFRSSTCGPPAAVLASVSTFVHSSTNNGCLSFHFNLVECLHYVTGWRDALFTQRTRVTL